MSPECIPQIFLFPIGVTTMFSTNIFVSPEGHPNVSRSSQFLSPLGTPIFSTVDISVRSGVWVSPKCFPQIFLFPLGVTPMYPIGIFVCSRCEPNVSPSISVSSGYPNISHRYFCLLKVSLQCSPQIFLFPLGVTPIFPTGIFVCSG